MFRCCGRRSRIEDRFGQRSERDLANGTPREEPDAAAFAAAMVAGILALSLLARDAPPEKSSGGVSGDRSAGVSGTATGSGRTLHWVQPTADRRTLAIRFSKRSVAGRMPRQGGRAAATRDGAKASPPLPSPDHSARPTATTAGIPNRRSRVGSACATAVAVDVTPTVSSIRDAASRTGRNAQADRAGPRRPSRGLRAMQQAGCRTDPWQGSRAIRANGGSGRGFARPHGGRAGCRGYRPGDRLEHRDGADVVARRQVAAPCIVGATSTAGPSTRPKTPGVRAAHPTGAGAANPTETGQSRAPGHRPMEGFAGGQEQRRIARRDEKRGTAAEAGGCATIPATATGMAPSAMMRLSGPCPAWNTTSDLADAGRAGPGRWFRADDVDAVAMPGGRGCPRRSWHGSGENRAPFGMGGGAGRSAGERRGPRGGKRAARGCRPRCGRRCRGAAP